MRRLREHDVVSLSLADRQLGERTSSFHVIAMFESVTALHPLDPAALKHLPEATPDAYISFRYEGQLVALRGTVLYTGGVVRFRVSDGVTLPRRSSTRVELVAPVTVRRRDGSSAAGVTLDIALDGALIELDVALEVGEEILLSAVIPARELPVEAAARVARIVGGQAGVAFLSIDQEARRFLGAQIYERSLAALSRGLAAARVDDDVF